MPSKILDWIIILNTENSQNALKYQKSLVFSKFQLWCYFVLGSGQKLADMWLGRQHSPKVIPQIFLSQTDKNWRFYLKKYFAWRIFDGFLADFWSKRDPFAIMTIKKQWIFIRGNCVCFLILTQTFFS